MTRISEILVKNFRKFQDLNIFRKCPNPKFFRIFLKIFKVRFFFEIVNFFGNYSTSKCAWVFPGKFHSQTRSKIATVIQLIGGWSGELVGQVSSWEGLRSSRTLGCLLAGTPVAGASSRRSRLPTTLELHRSRPPAYRAANPAASLPIRPAARHFRLVLGNP